MAWEFEQGQHEETKMTQPSNELRYSEKKVKIAMLYCKWCPNDCKGLTDQERAGCLAAGGFADELSEFGYRSPEQVKEIEKRAFREGVRLTHEDMKRCHYIIDYDLDACVERLLVLQSEQEGEG